MKLASRENFSLALSLEEAHIVYYLVMCNICVNIYDLVAVIR